MKRNISKSSITLPIKEVLLVEHLRRILKLHSKVQVVRLGLKVLQDQTDRKMLKESYLQASYLIRKTTPKELDDLDHLAGENVE
jgi:hypothetical protein